MNSKYFRRRKPFDFDPHPLDVGVPFSKNDTHADVHFLIKVQRLPESQLEDLFLRHFNYYKAEFNDTDGREFFKELWQTVNSELKKERSKSQEKLSATQKRRNDLRIQKFQYFIENILPKYDRWNFTVSLSKKYEIVSEQLLQEVKSKTQIEFQRTPGIDRFGIYETCQFIQCKYRIQYKYHKNYSGELSRFEQRGTGRIKKAIHPETKSRSFASTV